VKQKDLFRNEQMKKIATEIRDCDKCPLFEKRRKAVPGEGAIDSSILFLGEAPGYWEDVKGSPFAGRAGKILDSLLTQIGLSRDKIFITNLVKCRPPENRAPKLNEIKACTSLYLNRQIALIQPKIIVTLGNYSTVYIFSKAGLETEAKKGITQLRGKVQNAKFLDLPVLVVPMFHPAAILHNPNWRRALEIDFELFKSQLQKLKLAGLE
jgi:uracil-DNA glycosylase family 4